MSEGSKKLLSPKASYDVAHKGSQHPEFVYVNILTIVKTKRSLIAFL
jgi:hypothetical protein